MFVITIGFKPSSIFINESFNNGNISSASVCLKTWLVKSKINDA